MDSQHLCKLTREFIEQYGDELTGNAEWAIRMLANYLIAHELSDVHELQRIDDEMRARL